MPSIERLHEPDPAILALLDMLAVRSGCAAVGMVEGDRTLAAATPAFRGLSGRAAIDLSCVPPGVTGIAKLVPTGGFWPQAGFVAAIVVAALDEGKAVHLIIADPRRRRLTPTIAAAMRDGARILGRLFAAPAASHVAPARADSAAALRWITATLREQRAAGESALLMLDLDRFHALNEVLGTAAGDLVLTRTAARIEATLGPGERLLRLDGDRFAILAERAGADPRSLADRLLRAVATPMELDGRSVTVEASIGIVDRITEAARAATLLPQGTAALRRAKIEGRNRYVLHVPAIDTLDLERSRLEFDLAHALAQGQMQLVFQPYVSLAPAAFADTVAGAEALLRWQHPTRGEMRPASFVPLAEASGLILPLGAWTLRRALEAASRWPDRLMLAVNISALQFHQSRFVAEVDAALASTGFPAERLELEITETVLMRDNPQTVGQLRALIARGIRIALDDFGTGYSALAYLARLPHHRIKLGRSFIQDLANPATAELIRAIVASARAQGVAITAEGAETDAQLEAVRAMGFTHAQGYVIGVPVADPAELFAKATA